MEKSFQDLPDELKLKIFLLFTKTELCWIIPFVCKDWWILSKDPSLWKEVILDFSYDAKQDVPEPRLQRIASRLKQCTMLDQLTISCYWKVPNNFFSKIGSIPSLKSLSFYDITLKENIILQISRNYPLIQKLSFVRCRIEYSTNNFVSGCAALVHLKEFVISSCKIASDLDDTCLEMLLRSCPKLECLEIDMPNLTDKGILKLTKSSNKTLQRLWFTCMRNKALSNGFEHFGSCQKLISLKLQGNFKLSKASLKALSALPILESLSLWALSSEGKWVIRLEEEDQMEKGFEMFFENLFRANLKAVHIGGLSLGELALINMSQTCSTLQTLYLHYCDGVTESGVRAIFEKCCALDNVWITNCYPLDDTIEDKTFNNVHTVLNR